MKYFEDRPGAFLVSGNSVGDTRAKRRIWIELAHKLNGVEGELKTTARWAKYWNDLVLYTKMRADQAVNGGKDYVKNSRCHPSEFDQRLLRIVGKHDLLQEWLVLCGTSTKEETGEEVSEELNDDFEWSETVSTLEDFESQLKLFLYPSLMSLCKNYLRQAVRFRTTPSTAYPHTTQRFTRNLTN